MTDELDILRRQLKSAAPTPDAERKADALARAMDAFDQELVTVSESAVQESNPAK